MMQNINVETARQYLSLWCKEVMLIALSVEPANSVLRLNITVSLESILTCEKEGARMNIYEKAVNHFGAEHQKLKTIEELSELTRAIARNDRSNIVEELADAYITSEQLCYIYGISYSELSKIVQVKLDKLAAQIER